MALSPEDKKDVARSFGKKAATAVSKATHDKPSRSMMRSLNGVKFSGKSAAEHTGGKEFGGTKLYRDTMKSLGKSRALDQKAGKPPADHYGTRIAPHKSSHHPTRDEN
jgi:hypothetical protein